jgi:YVTN family beta-propeller protein
MRSVFPFAVLAAVLAAAAPAAAAPHYHVVAQLPAGDGGWDILSVDPVDQRLYVGRPDGVTAIDLRTGKATDRIVPGQRVHAALAIPGTHEVISTNGESNTATLFDGRTGEIRATIPTGKKPDAAAYDPATRTLWVMDPGSGEATVIDPVTAKVLATVAIGGSLEFAAPDGRGRMYVNVEDKNEVAVLDTKARKVLSRFRLAGCDGPTGIAYDAAAGEIVSACGNGVAVVSAPDGRQIGWLMIGKGADGAAYDPKRHLVLIPAGRDGNLSVIRLWPSPAVIAQIPTAVSARTIALDPATGRAYLPAATLAPAVRSERPKAVPGTFRVLVVAPF